MATNEEKTAEQMTVVTAASPALFTYQLIIRNGDREYLVDPMDPVELTRDIDCKPAHLTFSVLLDGTLDIAEGNALTFSVNGTIVFKGYIFELSGVESGQINVSAYDQLRYLKNKDCYVYKDKTATEIVREICADFGLKTVETAEEATETGQEADADKKAEEEKTRHLASTQYVIPRRVENNKTLADIIMTAVNLSVINNEGHEPYFVYDDAGKINLQPLSALKTDVYVDEDCVAKYNYRTSIDRDTYNRVKIIREAPGKMGKKLVKTGIVEDEAHEKEWGVLQYLMKPDERTTDAVERAKRMLKLKNRKTREIRLKDVIGSIEIRGGSSLYVNLVVRNTAESKLQLNGYYMVNSVTHHFSQCAHLMDLALAYYEATSEGTVTYDNDEEVQQKIVAAKKMSQGSYGGAAAAAGSGADGSLVDQANELTKDYVSPYGANGCVDNVVTRGQYYNADLDAAHSAGIANVDSLCTHMENHGYTVEAFDGYAEKGDILIYGNREHVVTADGVGGCWGNSSSLQENHYYPDANYAWHNGEAPTEIIRMSSKG